MRTPDPTARSAVAPRNNQPEARETFLTERDLAYRWSITAKKLQADRLKGGGCPFHRFGRCIRYRLTDVEAYEAANTFTSTTQA
jgi:hypothetical protein